MSSKKLHPFKDHCSLRMQNAEMNLTPVTGTTNGFIFEIINSLIESCGVRLTCLDCNLTYVGGREHNTKPL